MTSRKARVWNVKKQRWVTFDSEDTRDYLKTPYLDLDGNFCLYAEETSYGDYHFFEEFDDFEDFIVEYCTGLVDKNGTEIYGGDIISVDSDKPPKSFKVIWSDEYAQFLFEGVVFTSMVYEYADFNVELEVIGNIHENLELIE